MIRRPGPCRAGGERRRAKVAAASGGFTLIELIVSLSMMAIILGAMGSAIMLAARAIPGANNVGDQILDSASVGDSIAAELRCARLLLETGDHAVTFTVADRDGDGKDEKIRYAWSGHAGDPLTRQYNGGTAVNIADSVQGFNLTYATRNVSETYPGGPVESSQQLLASVDSSYNNQTETLSSSDWWAQAFAPSLPAGALSWSVQRVLVFAKPGTYGTTTLVQLRTTSAGSPSSTIVDQTSMANGATNNGWQWREFDFANATGLTPSQTLSLTLASASSNDTLYFGYLNNTAPTWGQMHRSQDSGSSWASRSGDAMRFYAYGTITTQGADQTVTRPYLTRVDMQLIPSNSAAETDTAVSLLNTPPLATAVWQADFASDPTVQDDDADGTADWARADGVAFDTGSLLNGAWQADSELVSRPAYAFTGLTTATVRMRNTSVGGYGAVFRMNVACTGSQGASIVAALALQSDGTQTLTLASLTGSSSYKTLTTVPSLPGGYATVRLVINPATQTVNLRINGAPFGTYAYSLYGYTGGGGASLLASGSAADFDDVYIVEGGS